MALTHVNSGNFKEEVQDSDLPVIIDFWAPWCAPCQMMGPVFEELSEEYKDKLKFAKLNTDEEQALATMYSITGIPCLIIAKKGNEVDRIVGFASKDVLKQRIETILEKV